MARRRALLARYRTTLELTEEELDSREIEATENAAELWDARVGSALGDVDVKTLAAVTAALRRIDRGHYGTCATCGAGIETVRLELVPETELCAECATLASEPLRA